jgi:hypothetical protein
LSEPFTCTLLLPTNSSDMSPALVAWVKRPGASFDCWYALALSMLLLGLLLAALGPSAATSQGFMPLPLLPSALRGLLTAHVPPLLLASADAGARGTGVLVPSSGCTRSPPLDSKA